MAEFIDLRVVNGDFVLDSAGFAEAISDRESIGQDVKHRLIESSLPMLLVAERSEVEKAKLINQMIIEVEKDERLKPGTVQILFTGSGTYLITASTYHYGETKIYL